MTEFDDFIAMLRAEEDFDQKQYEMQDEEKNAPEGSETPRRIKNAPMASYQYGEEPEIVRFVRTCFSEPTYHVLREDAYGIWPWHRGDGTPFKPEELIMTKSQVKEKFGIDLDI